MSEANQNTKSANAGIYSHGCFMHIINLILALIGEICAIIFRKNEDKRKLLIGAECGDILLMLIISILGTCIWDWIAFAVGTVAIAVTILLNKKSVSGSSQR